MDDHDEVRRESSADQYTPWHALSVDEVTERLGTDAQAGLGADAVAERRERHGANRLPRRGRESLLRVIARQFTSPLVYVLLLAGIVSLAIGNVADAAFVFAVLLLNAGLGAYQEFRAENAAAALEAVLSIRARVLRNGEEDEVDSVELVPGDLVRIEAGAAVPADLRLLDGERLRADESLLTGESEPVDKSAEADCARDASLADRPTLLHAGTSVTTGRGTALVVRTGERTEVGRIAEQLAEDSEAPPLVLRMRRFTRVIAVGILGVILLLGAVQFIRGAELADLFVLAVALAVSAIPAGLPVAITVALSIAASRMAEHNVVVRQLPAVEGLGACTLIATDKTGTLTQNQLTASRLSIGDATIDVEDSDDELPGGFARSTGGEHGERVDPSRDEALRRLLTTAVLCNEGAIAETDDGLETRGDTLDIALLVLGRKAGLDRDALLEEHEAVASIPFESERRYSASFHRFDGDCVAHVKGAAATVAAMCDVDVDEIREREGALARRGFRVLAFAAGATDAERAREADETALAELTFLGLVGLIDPLREEAEQAVHQCRQAGITVCMITGDHALTALAIGRQLGMAADDEEAVTGDELEGADEEGSDLVDRVSAAHVFARVEPVQKTRIVELLQDAGHFVAVTGDGVNDAPALRRAHIGVAMGRSGTDVARGAADLILTDDNFASIVQGVREGRVAYDNVRKVIWLLVSTAVAELVLFTLAVAFDTPLPLTPVQLLWLNLVTNGIQDVALAFEKGEPGVLSRRPRRPDQPIFDRLMIEQVLVSGVYMGVVAFVAFHVLHVSLGYELFDARNLLVLLLVLFENVHLFNVRSEGRSAFRIPIANNPLLVLSALAAQGVHIASMFVPGWRDILGIAPVSIGTWATLLAITLSKFGVVELYKLLRARPLIEADRQTRPAAT